MTTATAVPTDAYSYQVETPVTYGSQSGALSAVDFVIPEEACEKLVSAQPSYGSSSLSVTVTVEQDADCLAERYGASSSQGLSTAAVVGIAVGGCVAVVAITIIAVLVGRNIRFKRMDALFAAREAELNKSEVRMRSFSTRADSLGGEA